MNDIIILWLKRGVYAAVLVLLVAAIGLTVQVGLMLRHFEHGVQGSVTDLQAEVNDLRQVVGDLGGSMIALPETPAGQEIQYLLSRIGDSRLRYEYEGKSRPAAWVSAKLYAKYRLHPQVKSAEEFIRDIASMTAQRDTYYVIDGNQKQELGAWLSDLLGEFRRQHAP